jgi:zinc protease
LEDTPQGEAELFFLRSFFKESPYRFPVQGRPEVVRAMTRQDLATWHKKLVTAGNVVVAVFGGVDSDKALERAARAFEKLPAGPAPEFPKNARGREVGSREVAIRPTKKDIAVVYVAYPGFDIYNLQDRFPMDVLDTILSGYQMPGGWLHNELRGKGLVYEVHAYSMAGLRPGYFTAYALCRPDKAPEVVRIIEQNMARATKEKFTESQIVPARATVITAKELARETLAGWSLEAAIDECFGLGYGFAREEIEGLRKVTPEDLSRVARWYLRQPVICVVTSDPTAAESLRK